MYKEYLIPISIKGIVIINGKYLLVKNNRNEWELPGGRLEQNESSEKTVVREIKEELNLDCKVHKIVDTWIYKITDDKTVFIVTYLMHELVELNQKIIISAEHNEYGLFEYEELNELTIPAGYINSIKLSKYL